MASGLVSSNKAKIARRVVEVLDYFDDDHREATVMDIVRRYNRPQSSTSELLSSLVELGLLHKDAAARTYSLAPRAAMLGSSGQPPLFRDGRVVQLLDRLSAQTGLSAAVFGRVGLNVQLVSFRHGNRGAALELFGGTQIPLADCAAGWLLLSNVPPPRCDGIVRRLIAEAPADRKFGFADMSATLRRCRDQGHAFGPAGFVGNAETLVTLLPGESPAHQLAVGFVYETVNSINTDALLGCLEDGLRHCRDEGRDAPGTIEALQSAA